MGTRAVWTAAGTTLLVAACGYASSGRLHSPSVLAHGGSELCPDGPVDPYANGLPSSTARRCSYDDAIGVGVTRLGGRVSGASEGGRLGPGLGELEVTVHRVEDPADAPGAGATVARTVTDLQGSFHVSAVLPPATYDVAVRERGGAPPLTTMRLDLSGGRPRRLENLRAVAPVDVAPAPRG